MPSDRSRHYRGKLLLTGEYFVLDGVPALAVPTRLGQRFTWGIALAGGISWRAFDVKGNCWLDQFFHPPGSVQYLLDTVGPTKIKDPAVSRMYEILTAVHELSTERGRPASLIAEWVRADLEFDRTWGLGSSSTLIAGVAEHFGVNPYALLEKTFGGSGYDLACATATGPLLYERNGIEPTITELDWHPDWLSRTHFVHLNRKQNSRDGIRAYRERPATASVRDTIAELSTALIHGTSHLRDAQKILHEHERVCAATLGLLPVQEQRFADFDGQIKSLGAWGGDFVWALGNCDAAATRTYFNDRGYETVIPYDEMI